MLVWSSRRGVVCFLAVVAADFLAASGRPARVKRRGVTTHTAVTRTLVAAAFILVAASASAAQGARLAATLTSPRVGQWKTSGGSAAALAGTFTVTRAGYVTKLQGVITPSAETSCGTGKITVPGRLKIFDASGTSAFGAYNEYVVGLNEPSSTPVIQPMQVVLTHDGHRVNGRIDIVFPHAKFLGSAEITYTTSGPNGGGCDLQFDVTKKS